jgi:hypothetical protein
MGTFINWLETFLEEKDAPYVSWELTDESGTTHMIDSDVVVEFVKYECSADVQDDIKNAIVKIDFMNGDINHYLRFLAQGIVSLYAAA